MGGPKDFRLDRLKGARVYFSPLGPATEAAFDALRAQDIAMEARAAIAHAKKHR